MKLTAVILAAGLGTRMKSGIPKVMHPLCGRPMIQYVMEAVSPLRPEGIIVVINKDQKVLMDFLKERINSKITIAFQNKPIGTGDALKSALPSIKGDSTILVLNGDTPLIRYETLKRFLHYHRKEKNEISILSFYATDPSPYGRIIKDSSNNVIAIRERVDASRKELEIKEVNSGIYLIEPVVRRLFRHLKKNPVKGEYFLTDIVEIANKKGMKIKAYPIAPEEELLGINTRIELARASSIMRRRINERFMLEGVTIINPETTYISPDVTIGSDTIIYPGASIEGRSSIGKNCIIYSNARIVDSVIGENVVIKDSSVIEESVIKDNSTVGPFAHLRSGSVIGENVKIGNFVEVKKSIIGEGTKAMHLSYLGDAEIGRNVNIGAGTITCNYDGFKKHKTVIEDNVFIGSDTQLVAPVRISRGAYVGAGSTITKDVPPESLAVTRTPQRHIPDWAKKRRQEKGKD